MATYDFTGDGDGTPGWDRHARPVLLKRKLNAADIIASNATMVAAAKITSGDVIQAIDVPANFIFKNAWLKTITAGTASATANIGIAGSTEIFSGASLDSTAGTIVQMEHDASWGTDNYGSYPFEDADTIDFTAAADILTGEWDLYVEGVVLD